MRRLIAILLIVAVGFLVVYAFIPGVKGTLDSTVGVALGSWFGGVVHSITSSGFWQNWIVPWPNQLVIGLVIGIFPVAWFIHRGFNKARGFFVKSAIKESAIAPTVMTVPSQVTPPTATTRETAPAPQPTPPPQPPLTPEPKAEES